MTQRVVLIGGGGHASDLLAAYEAQSRESGEPHPVIGLVDDHDIDLRRFRDRGVGQIGTIEDLSRIDATHYLIAKGWPLARRDLLRHAEASGLQPATLIHPRAYLPSGVSVGEGTVVLAGVVISELASIGRHAYISHGVLLGHDCIVEDFVSVMPGASVSGDTVLRQACVVGSNATVLQGKTVGFEATVGAGSVVLKDVPDGVTAVGVPAKW
jgi:sugar O-acyltransferase (sialic acid O-acetyltransferase NeuD family)